MRRLVGAGLMAGALGLAGDAVVPVVRAEIQVINGVRYECSDGLCRRLDEPAAEKADEAPADEAAAEDAAVRPARLAQGYMDAEAFLAFLRGDEPPALSASAALLVLTLLMAGAAMNLTPCVLPMVPVNLLVIGASPRRGLLYGLGIAVAYGLLGVFAAVGGLAFGTIQANPLFNAFVALVFAVLGLSLCGAFPIDFTRLRGRAGAFSAARASAAFPFLMGVLSAVLAGACVAPVLVSALVLTAKLSAQGRSWALALPFALGLGMAAPWPFLGAGLRVLPKPGAWMRWVNRALAVAVFGFAAWYATLAARGFLGRDAHPCEGIRFADGLRPGDTPRVCGDAGDVRDVGDVSGVIDVDLASLGPHETPLSRAPAGKPVLVDCWATWCKSCAAMAHGTLRDPAVAEALAGFTVIRLQAEDIAALRRLPGFGEIRGLPAFALFEGR